MRARRWILRGLAGLLVGYGAVVLLLALFEDRLVYHPWPHPGPDAAQIYGGGYSEVGFASRDGTKLVGVHFPRPAAARHVVYFHGNAGNAFLLARELARIGASLDASVLAVDYRGYGKSEGTPSERGVLEDGLAAFDELRRLSGADPSRIVVYGHSLGGGVAVHVAAARKPGALVLESTFAALPDAAAAHYPWVPVRLLMRNRYPSKDTIRGYDGPLFQTHARADPVVPFASGKALFDAAPGADKRFVAIDSAGHDDPLPAATWEELRAFLDRTR